VVVELLGHPVAQLVEQRLDLQPRHQQAEQPPGPAQLVEVADQRPARAGVLDLHRDLPAVASRRLVHLADGRRGGRGVAELGEVVPPVLAQVGGQHLVHGAGGQRRRGLLQLGQRGPVRPGDLGRQRRLEDGQRLAQLHGAALELAEDPEDLVGGALLYFLGHDLGRPAADPLPDPEGRAARQPDRQPGHLGGPGHGVLGTSFTLTLSRTSVGADGTGRGRERAPHPHAGCGAQVRRRHCQSGSTTSSVPFAVAGRDQATRSVDERERLRGRPRPRSSRRARCRTPAAGPG
jgi:hypothetical protein